MTLLTDLIIAGNKFTGTLPPEIVQMPKIARLDLVSTHWALLVRNVEHVLATARFITGRKPAIRDIAVCASLKQPVDAEPGL